MSYIGKEPQVGGYNMLDSLTASATADYTLQLNGVNFTPESANHLILSLNGVIQKAGSSFTVSGSTLSFSSALTASDSIDFVLALGNVLDIGTPSDNTVSLAKLTATGTKDATTFLRGDNTFATAGVDGISSSADATAITIDSSENVGIGTTTINAKLVVSDNRTDYCARFINDGNDSNRDGILVQGGHDTGAGTTTFFLAADGDGTSTGELQTSSGTFQLVDTSDSRLKQDIVDTSINGIDSIKNLKVRDFAYKKNPTETIVGGFIAQELKEVFPQAVSEGKTEEKILSVSRERLVPLLTKALQEAITKIETLEAENTDIKARLTALENA